MTHNDLKCTMDFIAGKSEISKDLKACLLSPTTVPNCGTSEWEYYHNLFDDVVGLTINHWDLNHKSDYKFDIIIAHSIMMYAPAPKLWFDNIMNSCNLFLFQDMLKRQRSLDSEYGPDGDTTRYSIGDHCYFKDTFDITQLKYKIIDGWVYNGNANEFDLSPKHFISLITHDT